MVGDDSLSDIQPGSLVNNPTYGRAFLAPSDGGSSSGSSDYLSVSVNPHYQSMGEVMISNGHEQAFHGVPIPGKKGGHIGVTTSVSFVEPPSEPLSVAILSTSAPVQPVTSPPTPQEPQEDSPATRTDSINSANTAGEGDTGGGGGLQSPYSYATHHNRRAMWITSDYANSPHFSAEKRQHNYLLNPIQRIEEESTETEPQPGNNTITSGTQLIYHKHRRMRGESISYRITKARMDILLIMFTVLTILISLASISLCIAFVIKNKEIGTTSDSGNIVLNTQPPPTTASNILSSCHCTVNQTSLQLSESYLKQLLSIRQEIKELKWDKNFSMRDIIGRLSYYKYQIKVINEFLQQLMPQTNQPRQPTLSGLNLTSSISINHGDCFTERLECTSTGVINLNPGLGIDIGYCTTDYTSYANKTHIVVGASCSVVPHPNYYNTILPLPMGTAISINKNNNQLTGVTGLQLLKQSTVGCYCFNYNRHNARCYGYIKRCSYQEDSVQTGRISVHL